MNGLGFALLVTIRGRERERDQQIWSKWWNSWKRVSQWKEKDRGKREKKERRAEEEREDERSLQKQKNRLKWTKGQTIFPIFINCAIFIYKMPLPLERICFTRGARVAMHP